MIINSEQHPNSVWTWKSSSSRSKASLWLPYLSSIEKLNKKSKYRFTFKGGDVECDLSQIDFIMIYGISSSALFSVEFLDDLNSKDIILAVHRRNDTHPYLFHSSFDAMETDVLTQQILFRENIKKSVYISKTLMHQRFRSIEPIVSIPETTFRQLKKMTSVVQVRQSEAIVAKRFWVSWYSKLNLAGVTRRSKGTTVNQALDACSFFLAGILLRWVLFHKMSPYHGYLHVQTTYPALIYDLMEPYRYLIENSVSQAVNRLGTANSDEVVPVSIQFLKDALETEVYVPAINGLIRQKNLLHGAVLALRSYLIGETKRLVLPVPGEKKGGRPPQISYKIPGTKKPR